MSSAIGKRFLGTGFLTTACFLMYQDFVYKIVGITLISVDFHQLRDNENKTDLCLKNFLKTTYAIELVFNYISVSMIGIAFYGLLTRRKGFMIPYILLIPVLLIVLVSYKVYMRKVPCVERFYNQANGKEFWCDVSKIVFYFCYWMFLDHVYENTKTKTKKTNKDGPYIIKV